VIKGGAIGKVSDLGQRLMAQRPSDEEEADSFDKVARLVAGRDPPKWLVRHFKNWAGSLGLHRRVVMRQPTRSAMMELLREIENAAGLLSYALSNNSIRAFLENSRLGPMNYAERLENDLTDFALRIVAAKNSTLSSKKGGAKPGRGKAMPPDAMTPYVYCAAMIAEAWHFIHEGYPAPADREAAAAADVLWNLSKIPHGVDADNDERIRWGIDKLNGWRPHFIAALAQKPVMGNHHDKYVRNMKIAAQI
jgi:hypothetical protein